MPADLAAACRGLFERQRGDWLMGAVEGSWPKSVAVRAPSDRVAAAAPAAMRAWLSAWAAFDNGCQSAERRTRVVWRSVNWRVMGNVSLPEKILFEDANAVAACAGVNRSWEVLSRRWRSLCEVFPSVAGRRDCVKAAIIVGGWAEADFERLLSFLAWCERNPASGVYLRQLPVTGIHTKWVEARGGVIVPLLQAVMDEGGDLYQMLGVKRLPDTVRMRLLDPSLREQFGGAEDLQMPVAQWSASFKLPPKRLLIVENLATGLAIPDMQEAVVAMGLGNNGTVLEGIAWAHQARILYWGDIDTWGLHILSRVREVFPRLQSVLMTESVLESHKDLWTEEASQETREASHLTDEESQLLADLQNGRWGERIRLEQERINWASAVEELGRRWGTPVIPY
ncbi:Wadjet anti-phage system protein JetD domain-containing protein [Cupriavidus alkaliphilus]|uniref:Wadjet anti-phage system protein JetD domain-containing protein n=1 Tax=Cupriavidus alkaliphilus TaxID=942866 RepID=UPI0021AC495C|nr:DUF3322 and DUF2220 domain-containing protein [Cupriavidus alkaliphilus]